MTIVDVDAVVVVVIYAVDAVIMTPTVQLFTPQLTSPLLWLLSSIAVSAAATTKTTICY
jgi:hypothetical protein